MKKRSSLLFAGLLCMALSVFAAPLVRTCAANAAEKKGARIDYQCRTEQVYDKETEWWTNVKTNKSDEKYFTVVASSGAIVSYKEGKSVIATECDDYDEDGEEEYYYFKLPKKGTKEITVEFDDGTPAVTLKATVEAPKKNPVVTTTVKVSEAKYDPKAEGYKYGNITAKVEGLPESKKPNPNKKEYDFYASVSDAWADGSAYSGVIDDYDHPVKLETDREKAQDKERMNSFIKPLLRDGATVIVRPYYWIGEDDGKLTYSHTDKYYTVSDSSTPTELKVSLTTDTYKEKIKLVKVKIPKQKNPPKVKIDVIKGTIGITDKMEYQFSKYNDDGTTGAWDGFKAGKKGMKISEVSGSAIASGGVIEVRYASTTKALYSKSVKIKIPSQSAIDVSKIKWEGVTTNGSLTISDWNKDTKPYEYTTSAPSDSTKWTTVKDGKITFTKKNEAKGTIYIREKGINENTKKNTELKQPSTIAEATVSGSSIPTEKIKAYKAK